jgi:anti-anti-sigma factor
MLQLAIRHSGEVPTVWCRGRIVLGGRLNLLKVATFSQTSPKVMLDLSRVNLIDAAGLGALVDLHKRFQCASRKMELRDPTSFVYHVLIITRLDTVFHILRTPHIGGGCEKPPSWSEFIERPNRRRFD